MKKLTLLAALSLFLINFNYGQDQKRYSELVNEAWNLYKNKDFLGSGQKYSEAFAAFGDKGVPGDRYNAACSWALANQADSSFIQLFRVAEKGNYSNLGHITTDPDLHSLHNDERWTKVIEIVKYNKEKAEAGLDKQLVTILDTIFQEDQTYRKQIMEVEKKYGRNSEEMKAHWEFINEKDSVNLTKIKGILDERGWLGPDIVGQQGSTTLFLVIQHADLKTQEKYLPMMREAAKKGNARPEHLALLEDRVAIGKGERQIYGSQVGRDQQSGEYYLLPMIDPDNVDKRRSEVGLGSIQDYISRWGMTWNVEDYKKKLPGYEAKRIRRR